MVVFTGVEMERKFPRSGGEGNVYRERERERAHASLLGFCPFS